MEGGGCQPPFTRKLIKHGIFTFFSCFFSKYIISALGIRYKPTILVEHFLKVRRNKILFNRKIMYTYLTYLHLHNLLLE